MDVTKKCIVSGKHEFDSFNANRFAVIEVEAKNGDLVKVNKVDGVRYAEIWVAYEYPHHIDHPIVDKENKVVIVGGEEKESKRTICLVGK